MASYTIYQFYSELQSYTPAIWRRFQVPGNITMAQLGYIVMTLYEMRANHLFCLTVPIQDNFATFQKAQEDCAAILTLSDHVWRFAVEDPSSPLGSEGEIKQFDAASQKMKAVLYGQPGERLYLEYDYGDGWEVQLTLEAVTIDKTLPGRMLPRVLEGAGYGILEDCGGPGGLTQIADAFRAKKGPAYQDYCDWLGLDELDLAAFDLEDMNFRLKKIPRIYRGLYEYGYELTRRSEALLEREYLDD